MSLIKLSVIIKPPLQRAWVCLQLNFRITNSLRSEDKREESEFIQVASASSSSPSHCIIFHKSIHNIAIVSLADFLLISLNSHSFHFLYLLSAQPCLNFKQHVEIPRTTFTTRICTLIFCHGW